VGTGTVLYILEKRKISFPVIRNTDRPDHILNTVPNLVIQVLLLYITGNEILSRGGKCELASSCGRYAR